MRPLLDNACQYVGSVNGAKSMAKADLTQLQFEVV